jgi:hypothetical protein
MTWRCIKAVFPLVQASLALPAHSRTFSVFLRSQMSEPPRIPSDFSIEAS